LGICRSLDMSIPKNATPALQRLLSTPVTEVVQLSVGAAIEHRLICAHMGTLIVSGFGLPRHVCIGREAPDGHGLRFVVIFCNPQFCYEFVSTYEGLSDGERDRIKEWLLPYQNGTAVDLSPYVTADAENERRARVRMMRSQAYHNKGLNLARDMNYLMMDEANPGAKLDISAFHVILFPKAHGYAIMRDNYAGAPATEDFCTALGISHLPPDTLGVERDTIIRAAPGATRYKRTLVVKQSKKPRKPRSVGAAAAAGHGEVLGGAEAAHDAGHPAIAPAGVVAEDTAEDDVEGHAGADDHGQQEVAEGGAGRRLKRSLGHHDISHVLDVLVEEEVADQVAADAADENGIGEACGDSTGSADGSE